MHMHILARDPLAFVMVVLCLAILLSAYLFRGKGVRFLVPADAAHRESAAFVAGQDEENAITELADVTQALASASSSFFIIGGAAVRAGIAHNDAESPARARSCAQPRKSADRQSLRHVKSGGPRKA
jgi:hypothetical protein